MPLGATRFLHHTAHHAMSLPTTATTAAAAAAESIEQYTPSAELRTLHTATAPSFPNWDISEDPASLLIPDGGECNQCPRIHNLGIIPVDGLPPQDSTKFLGCVMLIGEEPGFVEARTGTPFDPNAPTGQELRFQYLPIAGLDAADCYITNAVKCFDPYGKAVPPARVSACTTAHLAREVLTVQPRHVVAMGGTVARLLGIESVDLEHGNTYQANLWGHRCPVTITLHPAAGLHKTDRIDEIRADFAAVREALQDRRGRQPTDAIPVYQLGEWHPSLCKVDWNTPIGMDTETLTLWRPGTPILPWCVTLSANDAQGWIVHPEDRHGLSDVQQLMDAHGAIALHNAPYDRPVLTHMGLDLSRVEVHDTQVMAYNCGYRGHNQSLKVLGLRKLGIRMVDFDDLVRPGYKSAVLDWLMRAWQLPGDTFPKPQGRKWSVHRKLKRALDDSLKPETDILKRWGNWDDEYKWQVADGLGIDPPTASITMAPYPIARRYACMDAVATRRLHPILQQELSAL